MMMLSLQRSLHLLLYLAFLCQLIKSETASADSGEYYYDDVNENDADANDVGDNQFDRKSTEVAEERFFVNSVYKFLSDPSSEAFFIIRMFFQVIFFPSFIIKSFQNINCIPG